MTKKDPELAPDFLPKGNGKGNFLKKVPSALPQKLC
jgi:hypothetical protein